MPLNAAFFLVLKASYFLIIICYTYIYNRNCLLIKNKGARNFS